MSELSFVGWNSPSHPEGAYAPSKLPSAELLVYKYLTNLILSVKNFAVTMKTTIIMIFVYVITSFINIFCVQVHRMIFAEFHGAPPSYGG